MSKLKIYAIDFDVIETVYEHTELINRELVIFDRIYREAVATPNRTNTKKLVQLLNQLELEYQFEFEKDWDWSKLLYEGWTLTYVDDEFELTTQARVKACRYKYVKVSLPIDGGDPICEFF